MANLMEKGVLSVRKRTITHITKNIFWYIIYLLPIFVWLMFVWAFAFMNYESFSNIDLESFPSLHGILISHFGVLANSIIYQSLLSIFDIAGILPMFDFLGNPIADGILLYFSYFVGVYFIHLCVDFLLFIPKLCHKWMNSFTSTEDVE